MNRTKYQQNDIDNLNQLFYLPKNKYKPKEDSQKFIKLFKTSLNRAIDYEKEAIRQNRFNRKVSKQEYSLNLKTIQQQQFINVKNSLIVTNQTVLDLLCQRKKLIREVINNKIYTLTPLKIKKSFSKRCQTLESNQSENQENRNQYIIDLNNKIKLPAKIRFACSKVKYKKKLQNKSLPPLSNSNQSPYHPKKLAIQTLQTLKNYRQFENNYHEKQILTAPLSITSMYSPNAARKQSQKKGQLSNLMKNNLIHSRNKKIRYALDETFRYNRELQAENLETFFHSNPYSFRCKIEQEPQNLKQMKGQEQKNPFQLKSIFHPSKQQKMQTSLKQQKQQIFSDYYFRPWQQSEQKGNKIFASQDLYIDQIVQIQKKNQMVNL